MFLCKGCHGDGFESCTYSYKSIGPCEGCNKVKETVDCHNLLHGAKTSKPKKGKPVKRKS